MLAAARMTPADIVKLTSYVVGAQDLDALYAARRRRLAGCAPASTVIVVEALAYPELLVEIEAVAAANDSIAESHVTATAARERPESSRSARIDVGELLYTLRFVVRTHRSRSSRSSTSA